ncbi:uncharacterized protein [Rutidosis leptorrhynchoides]|uniref:uncharacterized protein n=1 Tax=Rutidosis leptorrhynchoides TaxID=125765 RepID=UPI003A99F90D
MDYTIPEPVTEEQMCPEMTAGDPGLGEFVEQEESSIMESPKRESSEWTDEKHSLYLKSMEASFVDQLNKFLDSRCWNTQNDCTSDSMSSRRIHVSTRCRSGQLRCQQTNCSNAEVTDQNFVQEDSAVQKLNTRCSKKRKSTSALWIRQR